MKNEKYMNDIPDELEVDTPDPVVTLHSQLKLRLGDMQRRRQEVFDKFGILIPPDRQPEIRLNLLVQRGLGITTEERLQYELEWVRILSASIENAVSEYHAAKRDQHLHLPDGQVKRVRSEENGNGQPS